MPAPRPWLSLAAKSGFTPASLAETLDGGQAFRWHRQTDDSWLGQWGRHACLVRLTEDNALEYQPLTDGTDDAVLRDYLALDRSAEQAATKLPTLSDPHLAKAVQAFPNLHILRQPFGETLLGFLCSATKQIVQIKRMLALLAEHHGSPLPAVCHLIDDKLPLHALPTWEQLAAVSEEELRACQLGFRARYIKGTAEFLVTHPGWLEQTAALPYLEAKAALCTLPGVGEKIADCVALFGLGHLEAFPVDTWMIKAMTRRYGLAGWSPTQVAHFGRVHFGPVAGLAQQHLFAWERAHGNR